MPAHGVALTSDAIIYLPGIMGSELVDAQQKVVWGASPRLLARQIFFRDVMHRLIPRPGDGITASRPLALPMIVPGFTGMEPYRALERRLQQVTLRPSAVLAFPFDWRRSITTAATGLAPVARAHLARWRAEYAGLPAEERLGRPEPRLTLVGHSMGGLVASWFATAMLEEGGDQVRLVVTLGTPFSGSVKALRVLASGEYLPLGLFSGALRDAGRKMPGLYELLATYDCVDEGNDDDGLAMPFRRLTPSDLDGVGAEDDLAEAALGTMQALSAAIDAEARGRIRCLVGTMQPTLQSVRLHDGTADYAEATADKESRRRENHGGDGTVFRYAALPPGVQPSYLPQGHGSLQKAPEGVDFAAAVAVERPLGAFQNVSELTLRVPDLAVADTPFRIEVRGAESMAMCQVEDAETNQLVTVQAMNPADGHQFADVQPPGPGVYRVSVAQGGLSPVEQLMLVADG